MCSSDLGLRVPADLSIAGFDDIAWASHTVPPLTTVRIPREEMGRAAARAVVAQLEGGPVAPAETVLHTALVVRASCAPPRR